MFFKWCPKCGKSVAAGGLCPECRTLLKPIERQTESESLHALYHYQGVLRSVVLRAKVNNENTAYTALCDLFCCNPQAITQGLAVDLIVPAPSSLWGRVRGRFDLAQGIALAMGETIGRPVEFFPRSFYFNYRKRAGRNNSNSSDQQNILQHPSFKLWRDKSVLLIDDVITTGFTLNYLRETLTQLNIRSHALALASAHESHKFS